jgi:hypothetical protein
MSVRILIAAAALAASASAATAERAVYLGFGADYGLPHSGDAQAFGSLIAGATFDLWENMGLGIEGEFGEPLGDGGDERETSRVRGLFTYDFGTVTGIASLGKVQYEIGQATFDGDTFGLGAQMEFAENYNGRFELIRDFNDDDYGTSVTTSRIAVFFKF